MPALMTDRPNFPNIVKNRLMKKTILLSLLLAGYVGYSQQILKRVTETENQQTVEIFVVRNGSTPCEFGGTNYFDSGNIGIWYGYTDTASGTIYTHDPGDPIFTTNINPVQATGITFAFFNQFSRGLIVTNEGTAVYEGETLVSYSTELLLTTEGYSGIAASSGNSGNLFYNRFVLAKHLNDGGDIPVTLWINIEAPIANYTSDGSPQTITGEYWAQFDGSSWSERSVNTAGDTVIPIGNICATMGNDSITMTGSQLVAFPNPADTHISIAKINGQAEEIDYRIIDMVGKVIGSGHINTGQSIDISMLRTGNYILSVTDGSGLHTNFKIIRK